MAVIPFRKPHDPWAFESARPAATLSARIVEEVREALFAKRLAPGDFLGTEKDLAEQAGVSRIVARDALRTLQALGVVEIKVGAGGGARIAKGNPALFAEALAVQLSLAGTTVREMMDAQRAIETTAAELAAENATAEDIARLRKSLAEHEETIADDAAYTRTCMRFHLAVAEASHNRVLVCEVMGRDAGWIAITSGIAGGADVVLVPEVPIDIEEACRLIKYRYEHGKKFAIVVVAEGAKFPEGDLATHDTSLDSFGHPRLSGIGQTLAEEIEKRTGYETRSVNLGHTQRGGTPTAYDRMLATRYGVAAIDLVHAGKFGRLVVLRGTQISDIPIADAIAKTRTVGQDLLDVAKSLQPLKG